MKEINMFNKQEFIQLLDVAIILADRLLAVIASNESYFIPVGDG